MKKNQLHIFIWIALTLLYAQPGLRSQELPAEWNSVEIGDGSSVIEYNEMNDVFTITSSNSGWERTENLPDGVHFLYTEFSGDGYVIADIINSNNVMGLSQDGGSGLPTGEPIIGVEFRESLHPMAERFGSYILLFKSHPEGENDAPKPNQRPAGPAMAYRDSSGQNNCYDRSSEEYCQCRFKKEYFRSGKIKIIREGSHFSAWYYEPPEGVKPMNDPCYENQFYSTCKNKDGVYNEWRPAAWDANPDYADAEMEMPDTVLAGISFTSGGWTEGTVTVDFKNLITGKKPSPPDSLKVTILDENTVYASWEPADEEYVEKYEIVYKYLGIAMGKVSIEPDATSDTIPDLISNYLEDYEFEISVTTGMKSDYSEPVKAVFDTVSASSAIIQKEKFIIYPNPASGDVLIIENNFNADLFLIKVFNMLGQQVLEKKMTSGKNKLSIAGIDPGLYIIEISDGKTTTLQKLIKK